MVITLFITSFLVFASLYVAPGDPLTFLHAGPQPYARRWSQAVSAQYGLDDPFLVQYWHWLTGVLHFDFGRSLQFREDVAHLIGARVPTTLGLIAMSGRDHLRLRPGGRDHRRAEGRSHVRQGAAGPEHRAGGDPVLRRRDHLDLGVLGAARAGSRHRVQVRDSATGSTTSSCRRSRCR